jgi:hypothetical protein
MALDIGALQSIAFDIGAVQASYSLITLGTSAGIQGSALTLGITGDGTAWDSTTVISFSGSGVYTGTPNIISSTSLTVPVAILSTATTGARTVTVTTGSAAPTASFTITALAPLTARNNIDYDQIRAAARQGTGSQVQMATGGFAQGHPAVFDANGNLIDPGGSSALFVAAPVTHSSSGATGQVALDSSGNFYWCYATNSWARIGPGGYSNSF